MSEEDLKSGQPNPAQPDTAKRWSAHPVVAGACAVGLVAAGLVVGGLWTSSSGSSSQPVSTANSVGEPAKVVSDDSCNAVSTPCVFVGGNSQATWQAPASGQVRLTTVGAGGGLGKTSNGQNTNGGSGAVVTSTLNVTQGDQWTIRIGSQGVTSGDSSNSAGAGGAASTVMNSSNDFLAIAGGGGGGGSGAAGGSAAAGNNAQGGDGGNSCHYWNGNPDICGGGGLGGNQTGPGNGGSGGTGDDQGTGAGGVNGTGGTSDCIHVGGGGGGVKTSGSGGGSGQVSGNSIGGSGHGGADGGSTLMPDGWNCSPDTSRTSADGVWNSSGGGGQAAHDLPGGSNWLAYQVATGGGGSMAGGGGTGGFAFWDTDHNPHGFGGGGGGGYGGGGGGYGLGGSGGGAGGSWSADSGASYKPGPVGLPGQSSPVGSATMPGGVMIEYVNSTGKDSFSIQQSGVANIFVRSPFSGDSSVENLNVQAANISDGSGAINLVGSASPKTQSFSLTGAVANPDNLVVDNLTLAFYNYKTTNFDYLSTGPLTIPGSNWVYSLKDIGFTSGGPFGWNIRIQDATLNANQTVFTKFGIASSGTAEMVASGTWDKEYDLVICGGDQNNICMADSKSGKHYTLPLLNPVATEQNLTATAQITELGHTMTMAMNMTGSNWSYSQSNINITIEPHLPGGVIENFDASVTGLTVTNPQ